MDIDKNISKLVHLLREAGWNTTASCGQEFEGIIVIACYHEQSGGVPDILLHLRNFLKDNGYEHFEIKRTLWQWHGLITEDVLVIKLLNAEWGHRWK